MKHLSSSCSQDTSDHAEPHRPKPRFLPSTIVLALLSIFGIVAVAVMFDYPGKIDLKLGVDGLQMRVEGASQAK